MPTYMAAAGSRRRAAWVGAQGEIAIEKLRPISTTPDLWVGDWPSAVPSARGERREPFVVALFQGTNCFLAVQAKVAGFRHSFDQAFARIAVGEGHPARIHPKLLAISFGSATGPRTFVDSKFAL